MVDMPLSDMIQFAMLLTMAFSLAGGLLLWAMTEIIANHMHKLREELSDKFVTKESCRAMRRECGVLRGEQHARLETILERGTAG